MQLLPINVALHSAIRTTSAARCLTECAARRPPRRFVDAPSVAPPRLCLKEPARTHRQVRRPPKQDPPRGHLPSACRRPLSREAHRPTASTKYGPTFDRHPLPSSSFLSAAA